MNRYLVKILFTRTSESGNIRCFKTKVYAISEFSAKSKSISEFKIKMKNCNIDKIYSVKKLLNSKK